MKKWCKIIETEDHQVLVERLLEEDKEVVRVKVVIDMEDMFVTPTATIVFEDDSDKADKAFEEYSEEQAEKFVSSIFEMMQE